MWKVSLIKAEEHWWSWTQQKRRQHLHLRAEGSPGMREKPFPVAQKAGSTLWMWGLLSSLWEVEEKLHCPDSTSHWGCPKWREMHSSYCGDCQQNIHRIAFHREPASRRKQIDPLKLFSGLTIKYYYLFIIKRKTFFDRNIDISDWQKSMIVH